MRGIGADGYDRGWRWAANCLDTATPINGELSVAGLACAMLRCVAMVMMSRSDDTRVSKRR